MELDCFGAVTGLRHTEHMKRMGSLQTSHLKHESSYIINHALSQTFHHGVLFVQSFVTHSRC